MKHSREKLTAMIWSRIPPCWRSLFVNISSGNSLMAERKTYFLKKCTACINGRMKKKRKHLWKHMTKHKCLLMYYIKACHFRISLVLCSFETLCSHSWHSYRNTVQDNSQTIGQDAELCNALIYFIYFMNILRCQQEHICM